MNTLVANVQLLAFMAHAGSHETPAHEGSRTGGGLFDQFFNSAVRGAGWSMGSRIMHALPIGLIVVLALVVAVVWFIRRRRKSAAASTKDGAR
ncbi:Uncharacterised protein [Mycobacteroides abscessus subsp. bolletii]|nr:Uncharacterised protein [Mycobacteroides abscessus]SKF61978.1 Uncharacterised protein [Mycobacteroides abscessus subsp. bolletii]SKH89900.1 Uncharacterised protein [Mycobacteroides abscessus subsp. bolletii]